VAITRAKNKLYIVQPRTLKHFDFNWRKINVVIKMILNNTNNIEKGINYALY
jgi:hypothetical protein